MIYARKQSNTKPKDLSECYRIMGTRAYIQTDAGVYFYEFSNLAELRKMQIEAVKENMKTGNVSDWECCDHEGKWSGFKQAKLAHSRLSKDEKVLVEKYRKLSVLNHEELSDLDNSFIDNHTWIAEIINWIDSEPYWDKKTRLDSLSVTTKTINSNFKVGVA